MGDYGSLGYIVGYMGIALGMAVPIPQLIKILRTKRLEDVSLGTYTFLVCCLVCYLIHAVYISAVVFIIAQSVNLLTNSIIWFMLLRHRMSKKTNN